MMHMILHSPPRIQRPCASAAFGKASPPPQKRKEGGEGVGGRQQRPGEYRDWGWGGFPKVVDA